MRFVAHHSTGWCRPPSSSTEGSVKPLMLIFCEAEPQENQHQTPTRQPVHTGSQHNSAVPQDSCTEPHPPRTEPSIHYWSSLSMREIKQRLAVGQTWRRGSFPYRCRDSTHHRHHPIQPSREKTNTETLRHPLRCFIELCDESSCDYYNYCKAESGAASKM